MKKPPDIRKRFLRLAYEQMNPNMNTMEGLNQALTNWYCFQYNVPPNDDKLIDMTVEELLVLHYMHKIRENPHIVDEITSESEDYEEWLKKEMGEDYVDPETMASQVDQLNKEDKVLEEEVKNEYPEKITTDFTKIEE